VVELVEIYRDQGPSALGLESNNFQDNNYKLREVHCNRAMVATMRLWQPPPIAALPEGLSVHQQFTILSLGYGSSSRSIIVVGSLSQVGKKFQLEKHE
jgi:hypothetical protein